MEDVQTGLTIANTYSYKNINVLSATQWALYACWSMNILIQMDIIPSVRKLLQIMYQVADLPGTSNHILRRKTDIPGSPQRHHTTIGEAFYSTFLEYDYHGDLSLMAYGHIHIPAGFDSLDPVKRWFILDLGVKNSLVWKVF
jgi:hypothetical protein